MNKDLIREYAEIMRDYSLTRLEISENGSVSMERAQKKSCAAPVTDTVTESEKTEPVKDYISITSPMVGVFYAAPSEKAEPFITLGDNLQKGQVICIIEAMKLMNEISSDYEGEVTEICVTNGQVVEYGTELFRIKR